MDNHPIPQDVTGFQFKLIGDMTLRQFAYLAVSIVFAWIFFASPLFVLIKLPLVVLFVIIGILLAFVPFEGRPMDQMIMHFLKALFAPNQYLYEKTGQENMTLGRSYSPQNPVSPLPAPTLITQPVPTGNMQEEHIRQELQKEKEEITQELAQVEQIKQVETTAQNGTDVHQKLLDLEQKLNEALEHKKKLEEELLLLTQKLDTQSQPKAPAKKPMSKPAASVPGVTAIADAANVILGVVKDPRGNVLPNILVEVQDKEGNPVRAFKTNATGQFASATALRDGTYTVVFDDPEGKNTFENIQITASGDILAPLQIISHDQREELAKSLFQTAKV